MIIRIRPHRLTLFGFLIAAVILSSISPGRAAATTPPYSSPARVALDELSREKRWSELLAAADEGMRTTPDQAAPYVFSVRALRMLGHLDEAQTLADAAVEHFPGEAELFVERAWIKGFRGNWTSAQDDARRAGELRPNLVEAILVEGIVHRETRAWEQAIDSFSRADRLRPNDAVILLNRGRAAVEVGRRDAAIADLDRSLQIDPRSAEAYFHRGRAYAAKGLLGEASRDLTKAIELRPEAAAPYVARGELLGRAGQWANAADDADTAIALGSGDLRAHLTTCRAAEALEAWIGMERRAQAMVTAFPNEARGYQFLFRALNGLKRTEEALQACDQAVRLSPDNSLLLLERATLLIILRRYPAAIDDCSRVLQRQPLALGYALRSIAYLRQNDLPRAEENAVNPPGSEKPERQNDHLRHLQRRFSEGGELFA